MKIQLSEASAVATTRNAGSASSPTLQAAEDAAFSLGNLFGANPAQEYWVDACQRFILTLDVLRQRGNNYPEQAARISPSVLNFAAEALMDGRTFERPVKG